MGKHRPRPQRPTLPKLTYEELVAEINRINREGKAADFLAQGPPTLRAGCLLMNYKDQFIKALEHYINCPHADGGY